MPQPIKEEPGDALMRENGFIRQRVLDDPEVKEIGWSITAWASGGRAHDNDNAREIILTHEEYEDLIAALAFRRGMTPEQLKADHDEYEWAPAANTAA